MPVGTWRKAAIPATLPQGPQGQGSTSWRSPRNQRCQAWLSLKPRALLPLAARTGQSSGQFALLRLRAQERGQATNYRSRLRCRVMKWDREKKCQVRTQQPRTRTHGEKSSQVSRVKPKRDKKKETEQEHRGTWGAKTEVLLRDQRKRGSGGRRGFR